MNETQKIWKGSPNFWSQRKSFKPEAVVIHIMDGLIEGTDSWFANPVSQVSAHYGISRKGEVHQYVKEEDTAWHAGRIDSPSWKLIKPDINPNLYAIGIEHEGNSIDPWPDEMKRASAALIREICTRWQIPIDRNHIIGHCEIYSRKPDCPAKNKSIIGELVTLAAAQQLPNTLLQIEEGLKMIEEGITIIKQAIK